MALKRIVYRRIRFPGKPKRINVAVRTFVPPVVTGRIFKLAGEGGGLVGPSRGLAG